MINHSIIKIRKKFESPFWMTPWLSRTLSPCVSQPWLRPMAALPPTAAFSMSVEEESSCNETSARATRPLSLTFPSSEPTYGSDARPKDSTEPVGWLCQILKRWWRSIIGGWSWLIVIDCGWLWLTNCDWLWSNHVFDWSRKRFGNIVTTSLCSSDFIGCSAPSLPQLSGSGIQKTQWHPISQPSVLPHGPPQEPASYR